MPSVVAVFYWIWLLGAVGVLIYRIYGRATGRRSSVFEFRRGAVSEAPDEEIRSDRVSATRSLPDKFTSPSEPTDTVVDQPPLPDNPARSADDSTSSGADAAAAAAAMGAADIHPAVLAAMRAEQPEVSEPVDPGTHHGSDLFSTESRLQHQPTTLGTLAPLHETLSGIEMPCELVPVTELGPRPPREVHRERLVLMTTTAGAGEVAARLADEFERLGLEVSPTGTTSCLARRRDHAVELRIHEFPDRVTESAAPAFPMAPGDAVVVEFLAA
ncbi:MAG: hypothetical protein ACR2QE_14485 [Acidimicrobiales bacterium]